MKPPLLVADRDAELRRLFARYLRTNGYYVMTATQGLDCLEKLRRFSPAALLLDLELCWGGGDGVLAWLREEGAAYTVPVIVTVTEGSAPPAAEPPIVRVLPKPFSPSALLDSVHAALARKGQEKPPNRKSAAACSELYIG